MMKEKNDLILKWAVIANGTHLAVAWIHSLMNKEQAFAMLLLMVISLLVWFFAGFQFGMERIKGKETDALYYGVVCMLPIMLYTLAAQILQFSAEGLSAMQNYNFFYFLGAPVLFWNTSFYPVMNLFPDSNIYMQMDINIILVVFISFLGAYTGRSFRMQQLRKNRKKTNE